MTTPTNPVSEALTHAATAYAEAVTAHYSNRHSKDAETAHRLDAVTRDGINGRAALVARLDRVEGGEDRKRIILTDAEHRSARATLAGRVADLEARGWRPALEQAADHDRRLAALEARAARPLAVDLVALAAAVDLDALADVIDETDIAARVAKVMTADEVAAEMDYGAVAEAIPMAQVVEAMDLSASDIASEVDAEDVADHIDCSDVADHIEGSEVARHIDLAALAADFDAEEVADLIVDRVAPLVYDRVNLDHLADLTSARLADRVYDRLADRMSRTTAADCVGDLDGLADMVADRLAQRTMRAVIERLAGAVAFGLSSDPTAAAQPVTVACADCSSGCAKCDPDHVPTRTADGDAVAWLADHGLAHLTPGEAIALGQVVPSPGVAY